MKLDLYCSCPACFLPALFGGNWIIVCFFSSPRSFSLYLGFLQELRLLPGSLVCGAWGWLLLLLYSRPVQAGDSAGAPLPSEHRPRYRRRELKYLFITSLRCLSFSICNKWAYRTGLLGWNRVIFFQSLHMKYAVDKMQAFVIIGLSCYLGCPVPFNKCF